MALFHYIQFYLEHIAGSHHFPGVLTLGEFAIDYYSWGLIAFGVVWLGHKCRIGPEHWRVPVLVHAVACVTVALLHIGIITTTLAILKPHVFSELGYSDRYAYVLIRLFYFECLTYVAVLGLSYGFEHYVNKVVAASNEERAYTSQLPVKMGNSTVLLKASQIDWLQAADNYVNIYAGMQSFLIREKLHVLEHKLDPKVFQRIHRSIIVNISQVKEIGRGRNGSHSIQLQNGKTLPVSRRRWERVQRYIAYL